MTRLLGTSKNLSKQAARIKHLADRLVSTRKRAKAALASDTYQNVEQHIEILYTIAAVLEEDDLQEYLALVEIEAEGCLEYVQARVEQADRDQLDAR